MVTTDVEVEIHETEGHLILTQSKIDEDIAALEDTLNLRCEHMDNEILYLHKHIHRLYICCLSLVGGLLAAAGGLLSLALHLL